MTVTALSIIQDAYERLNRLSPGETLSADDAAFGLRRLNLLADELSAKNQFLSRDLVTSVAQTGNITLGTGSWAAIASGDEIIGIATDNGPLSPITVQQYNNLYRPLSNGEPTVYAHDGLSTVFFSPVPTGQTLRVQTRIGVSQFADQSTAYTVPPGYKAFLGAALAVRCAVTLLGRIPPELMMAERRCADGVGSYKPAIIDVYSFATNAQNYNILNGI